MLHSCQRRRGGQPPPARRASCCTETGAAQPRAERPASPGPRPTVGAQWPNRVDAEASIAASPSIGHTRAHVDRNARPCTRLARFATTFVRNTSAIASSAASREESRWPAVSSGSPPRPLCQQTSRTNRRRASSVGTAPPCQAASSPQECAKPPVGKAESASCQIVQRPETHHSRPDPKSQERERARIESQLPASARRISGFGETRKLVACNRPPRPPVNGNVRLTSAI